LKRLEKIGLSVFLLSKETGNLRNEVRSSFKTFLGTRAKFENTFYNEYLVFYASTHKKASDATLNLQFDRDVLDQVIESIEDGSAIRDIKIVIHKWRFEQRARTQISLCFVEENLILAFHKCYSNTRRMNEETIFVSKELSVEIEFLLKYLKFILL
jgi:hypothetical protein